MRQRLVATLVTVIVGLAIGIGAGLSLGWGFPLAAPQAGPAELSAMWQADYILMTAQAYGLDGDLDTARQHLQSLLPPQASSTPAANQATTSPQPPSDQALGELVTQRGLAAIEEGAPAEDIGRLARLAAALGVRWPELQDYLAR